MPRVTKSVTAKAKHKKVLSATKGHYGARSRLFKTAKQSNIKSLQYAFRDRKNKKRAFRSLWIARINAGSRELGVSYSKLINALISFEYETPSSLEPALIRAIHKDLNALFLFFLSLKAYCNDLILDCFAVLKSLLLAP